MVFVVIIFTLTPLLTNLVISIEAFVFPFTITKDDRVCLLMVKPNRMSETEFEQYLELILIYSRYLHNANTVHLIIMSYANQERWMIEIGEDSLNNLARYDEMVDKVVVVMETKE